jgi:hypothetical protein
LRFRTSRTGNASWKNLKRWLQLRYGRVENKEIVTGKKDMASFKPRTKVVMGMINMVDSMKGKRWDDVEKILELLRAGLIAIDAEWSLDQWFAQVTLRCGALAWLGYVLVAIAMVPVWFSLENEGGNPLNKVATKNLEQIHHINS